MRPGPLAKIGAKLDWVTASEEQLGNFGRPWENFRPPGQDLSRLTSPGVGRLTEELAE